MNTEDIAGRAEKATSSGQLEITLTKHGTAVVTPDGKPFDFGDRPYVLARNASGQPCTFYRSYKDYCES